MLVFHAAEGTLGAMLLPLATTSEALDRARADLRDLAAVLIDRPALLATRETQVHVESLESAARALAEQAERLAEAPAAVVVNLHAGPQVVAISRAADARMKTAAGGSRNPGGPGVARDGRYRLHPASIRSAVRIVDRRQSIPAQVIPIGGGNPPLGALVLWPGRRRELTGLGLSQLLDAIREAEPRLTAARTLDELKRTATTDPLTGLVNRRALEAAMGRVGVEDGALIYADLDRFKSLNDTLGHPAGDAALVHFAEIIRSHVRTTDTAARLGGEEFAVWLPGARLELGVSIAERIRDSLAGRPWVWQGTQWPITASFGVAGCPETSRSRQNLATQADAALYRAKSGGRNRVETAERTG